MSLIRRLQTLLLREFMKSKSLNQILVKMLNSKDVMQIVLVGLLKHMTRDTHSLAEASPLPPLQGGLKSTTGVFHLFVEGTLLPRISTNLFR